MVGDLSSTSSLGMAVLGTAAERQPQAQAPHACCQEKADASRVLLLSTPPCTHTHTILALIWTADDVTASRAGIQATPKALEMERCRIRSFPSQSCKDPVRMLVLPRRATPLCCRGGQLTSALGRSGIKGSLKQGAMQASRELPRDQGWTRGPGTWCLQSGVFRLSVAQLEFPTDESIWFCLKSPKRLIR